MPSFLAQDTVNQRLTTCTSFRIRFVLICALRGSFSDAVVAMLLVTLAASSIGSGLTDCHYWAVPFKAEDCVPAASVTEMVAGLAPAAWEVNGLNCTVTAQLAPGAKVVFPVS
jgi:arginine/ornithine N-succinyltransferase beta subunit